MAARVYLYSNVPRTDFPRKMNENRKKIRGEPTHMTQIKVGSKLRGRSLKVGHLGLIVTFTRLLIDWWRALATRHPN